MMSEKNKRTESLSQEQKAATIPYYVHDIEMYRLERLNRRWFAAFLVVLVMLFVTNAGWIVYEHQYEDYYISQDVDNGSGETIVAGIGDVNYGQSQTGDTSARAEEQQQESVENLP